MKQFPTDADVTFLTCEFGRNEQNGKITLIGLFPDNRVSIAPGTTMPFALPLAMVFILKNCEGTFDVKVELDAPNHTNMISQSIGSITIPPDTAQTFSLNFPIFQSIHLGTYAAVLWLDQRRFERTLRIEQGSSKSNV
jgi:hypothetical protein